MRKTKAGLAILLSLYIVTPLFPAEAAVKAGAACSKAGVKSVASGKTFTCIKSGKKFVWDKGVAVTKPTVVSTPSATPPATPTPTPTPEIVYATLWEKYKWTKPASSSDSITAAISNFNSYVATTRTSGTTVTVRSEEAVTSGSQPGSSTWEKVMSDAVNLGAKAFTYPALTKPFYVYLATTSAWLGTAINADGFTVYRAYEFTHRQFTGYLIRRASWNDAHDAHSLLF